MKNKAIVAIIAITFLEALAIWQGIDGIILSTSLALLAGLGGYSIAKRK